MYTLYAVPVPGRGYVRADIMCFALLQYGGLSCAKGGNRQR